MIIVGELTKNYDTVIKMYDIIFKKCYVNTTEWWINNLFNNIQFVIEHLPKDINFTKSMINYIKQLQIKNIIINDKNKKIIDSIINKYKS